MALAAVTDSYDLLRPAAERLEQAGVEVVVMPERLPGTEVAARTAEADVLLVSSLACPVEVPPCQRAVERASSVLQEVGRFRGARSSWPLRSGHSYSAHGS